MRGSSRNSLALLSQCRTRDCATSVISRRARHTCHTAASFKGRAGLAVMFALEHASGMITLPSAVDVKDRVNGQAHIGLTLPSAGFRGGDQAFDILPFSVG